jgi:branched-chain amino acid aminotransferase
MAFSLSLFPWVYKAHFDGSRWLEEFEEKEHLSAAEEEALPPAERDALLARRNSFPDMPLVNYTTQYAMSCFEGLKAFPQKNGGLKLFRPDQNSLRMDNSMKGLLMPGFPPEKLTAAIVETVARNVKAGFTVAYDPEWEKEHFQNGSAVYVRPFSYTEGGIGINLSYFPYMVIVCTPVSAYFKAESRAAVTADMIRATPHGTGWIKCASNYVISALAKKTAEKAGFMEAIFLDAAKREFVEEGSSCNFFCLLKDGTLVTPGLGDTILPGITRKTVIKLARDKGLKVEERPVSIHEVLDNGKECFVTGTAAGISHFDSVTHQGRKVVYCNSEMGPVTKDLLVTLKGIQYGVLPDPDGWMVPVA